MDYIEIIRDYARNKDIDIYMVGGAVRNMFIETCEEPSDYDFTVKGDCHSIGRDIAEFLKGSYVNLHEDVARVVVEDIIFDFTNLKGRDIREDLKNRDFTINAIALELKMGMTIDLVGGIKDIEKETIRLVSDHAIEDDPVRMVRAVRFSSKLGFKIEGGTERQIKDKADLLDTIPGERILEELYKILESSKSNVYFQKLNELNLLERIFPIIKAMKTLGKCKYHTVDAYTHSLMTLRFLEENINALINTPYGQEIEKHLNDNVNGKKRICTIKLGAFLHDIGKPRTMQVEGDRVTFRGHEKEGIEEFKGISSRLVMSSKQKDIISSMISGHMRVLGLFNQGQGAADKALYRLFRDFGDNTLDVLICSLFDVTATRNLSGDAQESNHYWNFILGIIEKYFTFKRSRERLITGRDVMDITGAEGRRIGEILRLVDEQVFYGNIKTREDAVSFVKEIRG